MWIWKHGRLSKYLQTWSLLHQKQKFVQWADAQKLDDKSFHQHHIDYYDSYTVFEGDILFSLSGSWLNVGLLEQVYILLLSSTAALS